MSAEAFAAVDIGASSGRIVIGRATGNKLYFDEVHRFPNGPRTTEHGLRWDAALLRRHVLDGLRAAGRQAQVIGIGIDTWGVDYGLIDTAGALLADPYAYRDERTGTGVQRVHAVIPADQLYRRNGLQFLPFNTIYQLAVDDPTLLARAATMLLMPDLIGRWLTGHAVAERTNASTTGLLDPFGGTWAWDVIDALGFPRGLFPELRSAGEPLGRVRADVADVTGLDSATGVTLVGSHDTASAVVGVPAEHDEFAYISCGTWGLVGVELDDPILSDESRRANFTNERGVDGKVQFLRNVMGLWLLQESLRNWADAGDPANLEDLLARAAALAAGGPIIDPNDPMLLPPGDMPGRIEAACRASGQAAPTTRVELVRCILDSLADAFASAVRDAASLSGRRVQVVHLVGGGALNTLLCQLTADACDLPVVAGPVEATAMGNLLVQARSQGSIEGDLSSLRARVRASQPLHRLVPARRRATTR